MSRNSQDASRNRRAPSRSEIRTAGFLAYKITRGADAEGERVMAAPVGSDLEDGPLRWQPRCSDAGEPLYPQRDDLALVVVDNNGDFWLLEWWPYA